MKLCFTCFVIFYSSLDCSSGNNVRNLELHLFKSRGPSDTGELKCKMTSLDLEVGDMFQVSVKGHYYINTLAGCGEPGNLEIVSFFSESNKQGYKLGNSLSLNQSRPTTLNYTCILFTKHCDANARDDIPKWHWCKLESSSNVDYGVTCTTTVRVLEKGHLKSTVEPAGYLSANGKPFTRAEEHEEYTFYDGEATNFTCHRINGTRVQLQYNISGETWGSTHLDESESVSMYMKLRADINGTILKCTITNELSNPKYVVSLRLVLRTNTQGMLTVRINGLIPLFVKQDNYTDFYYEYKYNENESLTFAVDKDDKMYGVPSCSVEWPNKQGGQENSHSLTQIFNGSSATVSGRTERFVLGYIDSGVSLVCTVKQQEEPFQTKHIEMTFIYRTPHYSPYLFDLAMSNVLLEYSNHSGNTVQYEIGDEELVIVCRTPEGQLGEFLYNTTEVKTLLLEENRRFFQLQPGHNGAMIECKTNTKSTYLELVRRTVDLAAGATLPPAIPAVTPLQNPEQHTPTENPHTPANTGNGNPTTLPNYTGGTESGRWKPELDHHNQPLRPNTMAPEPKAGHPLSPVPPDLIPQEDPRSPNNGSHESPRDGRQFRPNGSSNRTPSHHQPTTRKPQFPNTPKPATIKPKLTTKNPKLATKKPKLTTKKPKLTTKKPKLTPKKPKLTTKMPVQTKTTIKKPVKVTSVPQSTTKTCVAVTTPTHDGDPLNITVNPEQTSSTDQTPKQSSNTEKPIEPSERTSEQSSKVTAAVVDATDASNITGNSWWMIVFGVAVVIFVIVASTWLSINYIKRRRMLKHSSLDLQYQNLPEHREGPMAIPNQWNRPDDITYSHAVNDNLYTTPLPTSDRNKLEPTYANPRDSCVHTRTFHNTTLNEENYAYVLNSEPGYASVQNSEPGYASVQESEPAYASVQKSEPAYASVQKAHLQNKVTNELNKNTSPTLTNENATEYQNLNPKKVEDTYAKVRKKSIRNSENPRGKDSKNHYANLNAQNSEKNINEVSYANLGQIDANSGHQNVVKVPKYGQMLPQMNYANIQELQNKTGYVNAGLKEQVEPAYCEVSKKN